MQQVTNTQINLLGSNGQIQFNNNSALYGAANLTFNVAANVFSVDANVRVANANMLLFGGAQGNSNSNSRFAVTYNATAVSLDFLINPN